MIKMQIKQLRCQAFFTSNNTRTKLQREKKEIERTKIYNEMVSVESLLNFWDIGSQYIIY